MGKADETGAQLGATLDHWQLANKVHLQQCWRCSKGTRTHDYGKLCEYGWDVLSRITAARNALRQHQERIAQAEAGQLELFG